MEENRVNMKLEDYIKMRDYLKELECLNETIIDYILSQAELENGELKIDYNIRYSKFLTEIVLKKYPRKYKEKLEELKKEEE